MTCKACSKQSEHARQFQSGKHKWCVCMHCLAITRDQNGQEFTGSALPPHEANILVSCINDIRRENRMKLIPLPFLTEPEKQVEGVAKAFSAVLHRWLTAAEWDLLLERTPKVVNTPICHSHDYCDANMAMDEACRIVFGAGLLELNTLEAEIMDKAWKLAKRRLFFADTMPPKVQKPTDSELIDALRAIVAAQGDIYTDAPEYSEHVKDMHFAIEAGRSLLQRVDAPA